MNSNAENGESQVTLMVPDINKAVRFCTEALSLRLKARYGKEFAVVEDPGVTIGSHRAPTEQSPRRILCRSG
jgi:catechol 2,3-dioxygenase-like lactoylglutathione lyase family enzyme